MSKSDPWGDAVNGRPMPNLPDPGQPENGESLKKKEDPAWDKAGAVTMAACVIAIVITVCLIVLHFCNVWVF